MSRVSNRFRTGEPHRAGNLRGGILRPGRLLPAVVLAMLLCAPGCGGCRTSVSQPQTPEELEKQLEARKEKLQEKKKPDFEPPDAMLVAQPYETAPEQPHQPLQRTNAPCRCKPGHWTAVGLPLKANHFDFLGDLEVAAASDTRGTASPLGAMAYWLGVTRPVALAKGQWRTPESLVFLPPGGKEQMIHVRLADHATGREVLSGMTMVERMPPYQYHFVVLARFPDRYGFLPQLDAFKNPLHLSEGSERDGFFRVVRLAGDRAVVLPRSALCWTSIAAVLWDEADPGILTESQQTALLDWLHWGGQLLISGPDSLDRLANSFLGPYLPATALGSRQLAAEDLKTLSDAWSPADANGHVRVLRPVQPWPGVRLDKHPWARFVPDTGDLLAERRVGRGRVVVSAFPLATRDLRDWPGFDSLVNACLLGRPPRRFQRMASGLQGELQAPWAPPPRDLPPRATVYSGLPDQPPVEPGLPVGLAVADLRHLDPARNCRLWYVSRDAGRDADSMLAGPRIPVVSAAGDLAVHADPEVALDPWCRIDPAVDSRVIGCGLGGWSDFNPVANAARHALQNAARIEIPEATFVLWVVVGYLVVLVPLNYVLFRLLGRIEWAWAAAPVIAVVGTVVVIRLARLDIGFERSATEVAVVELHAGHRRAHVTRYTALYTALYTEYRVRVEDPGALVLPFPTVSSPDRFDPAQAPKLAGVTFRQDGSSAVLEGFPVLSNSTNLVHSEQMADLGGPVRMEGTLEGGLRVTNGTDYTFRGAGVVWCKAPLAHESQHAADAPRPVYETVWLGDLRPGESVPLEFRFAGAVDPRALWSDERNRAPLTRDRRGAVPAGELNLRGLVNVAQQVGLAPGEMRLVAWMDRPVPGQTVEPAAGHSQKAAVIVAHLWHDFGSDPRPDVVPRLRVAVDAQPTVGSRAEDPFPPELPTAP